MKKTGNRILSVILTVVLLVGCIGPIGAFAAAPSYALKPQTAFKGATFAVTLTAKSIKGLQSGVVVIEYDPDVLTFKDKLSYSVTAGAIGLQSKLTKLNDTLDSAPYYGGEEGKSYLSYSFMATDAALVAADITRADTSELPLAQLFFTVYSKTTAPSTELKIVEAKTEVASKISVLPETAVSVAINPMNPARSAYTYSEKNDAKQYIDTAYSGTVSGAAAFYPTVVTGGLSSSAFADGADITGLTFVSPVIDKSSTKDPANPIEYPQAAFGNLTKLAAVNVNVTISQLSSSRFFTDDGIIYIRDVDAKGKLQNTCKVYLIPYAHAADVYLSNNVTGIFDDGTGVFGSGALCGKTKDDFTFHHKTHCDGDSEITTAPTCEGTGVRTYYCAFCAGKTKVTRTETVAATGHKWGAWTETKAPTCEGKGSEKRVCKNDKSHVQTRDVNPTGHAWGEWKVTTPPTCTEEGVETRVCKNDKS
ncbi:MAG: hypothetical protein IJL26_10850, partial [Clostridia bacterium]|nr:hypothetical protein [Clostridia bacterium]